MAYLLLSHGQYKASVFILWTFTLILIIALITGLWWKRLLDWE